MILFCEDLKDQAMKIINCEKKEMIPLTDEEKESNENQEICNICEKEFCIDEDNEMEKVRDHCHYTGKYRGAAYSICKKYKKIPVVFHNGSTIDYHFIIKQLAKEFKDYFHCLGENTEKYITFSVPIKKVLDNDNDSDSDNDNDKNKLKTVTYRLKFIDSYRFMQDSLSNFVDNLSEINNEPRSKFTDSMRSIANSLLLSIDKISEIDRKISQIDKKEPDNMFIDNIRSMISSLSQSIDNVSEIDRKISHAALIEKFHNT